MATSETSDLPTALPIVPLPTGSAVSVRGALQPSEFETSGPPDPPFALEWTLMGSGNAWYKNQVFEKSMLDLIQDPKQFSFTKTRGVVLFTDDHSMTDPEPEPAAAATTSTAAAEAVVNNEAGNNAAAAAATAAAAAAAAATAAAAAATAAAAAATAAAADGTVVTAEAATAAAAAATAAAANMAVATAVVAEAATAAAAAAPAAASSVVNNNSSSSAPSETSAPEDDPSYYMTTRGYMRTIPPMVVPTIPGFKPAWTFVRLIASRNKNHDSWTVDQTCLILRHEENEGGQPVDDENHRIRTLCIMMPHMTEMDDFPPYHPPVRAIALLHEWSPSAGIGLFSVYYSMFRPAQATDEGIRSSGERLTHNVNQIGNHRVRYLLRTLPRGPIVPRDRVQAQYEALKAKYFEQMAHNWVGKTNAEKALTENLAVAAFLIELWRDMYSRPLAHGPAGTQNPPAAGADNGQNERFPGFVDLGCGSGLLTAILRGEGYRGYGIDAREHVSWSQFEAYGDDRDRPALRQKVIVPRLSRANIGPSAWSDDMPLDVIPQDIEQRVHHGEFPEGTFIISKYPEHLTGWVPITAAGSRCPFFMMPCCSFNLLGQRSRESNRELYRVSAYDYLVDRITRLGTACGYDMEVDRLPIPGCSMNTALLGRNWASRAVAAPGGPEFEGPNPDLEKVVVGCGGSLRWMEHAGPLARAPGRWGRSIPAGVPASVGHSVWAETAVDAENRHDEKINPDALNVCPYHRMPRYA